MQPSAAAPYACAQACKGAHDPHSHMLCRLIDRAGGLDQWLLHTPDRLLHSDVGSELKFRIGLIYKQRAHDEAKRRRHAIPAQKAQTSSGGAEKADSEGSSNVARSSSGSSPGSEGSGLSSSSGSSQNSVAGTQG